MANLGTTNSGAIDELDAIADVCAELGLWLHIDAAYGGAVLCAPSTARRRGFERADSFGIDPHKWLSAPRLRGAGLPRPAGGLGHPC